MKKKVNVKIIVLSILNILLAVGLCFLIYITFIADSAYRKMGYSYSDINLIHKYQLEEKVTEYNQSFVYAINSQEFKQENLDYYFLFNNQIDYTRIINELAAKYSVEELADLKKNVTEDELIELVDLDKITNITGFKAMLAKQYTFEQSIASANALKEEELNSLLSIENKLEHPENFAKYVETGYDTDTILAIYNISEEDFNNLAGIRYFDTLKDLVKIDGFKIENLARYFWHMENYGSSPERAVTRVNIDAEYISQDSLNYVSFYTSNPATADLSTVTGLVNKSHKLSSDYTPENLTEVDANYRGNNQPLVAEVAEAFVKMSDACYKDTERRILAYSNYRSYSIEDSRYDELLSTAMNDESAIADYASRAGYSEHQTGLAVDISQKGYSYTELESCVSYDWLNENSYLYGFVRRYPRQKAWITGYHGNAYHFRYVGVEVATMMHKYGWVLEEYSYLFNGD